MDDLHKEFPLWKLVYQIAGKTLCYIENYLFLDKNEKEKRENNEGASTICTYEIRVMINVFYSYLYYFNNQFKIGDQKLTMTIL